VDPNSSTKSRSGILNIGGEPFAVNQSGVPCSFTISGTNPIFVSGGGTGSFVVTANDPSCVWTASSPVDWVTLTTRTDTRQSFTVSSNASPDSRSTTLTIGGQTAPINQSGIVCSYALRSSTGSIPVAGGAGAVGVLTAAGCPWTASTGAPWLTPATTGGGAQDLSFTAAPNTTFETRTGTITLQGSGSAPPLTLVVTQPGKLCPVRLPFASVRVTGAAVSGTTDITLLESCVPSVRSYTGWLTASLEQDILKFTTAANTSTFSRSGTIQIGDQTFTVNQDPGQATCSYSLNSYGAYFSSTGGDGSVLAGLNSLGCGSPVVGQSPELTLGPLTVHSEFIWNQPYTVPPYKNTLTNFVRKLFINFSGTTFTIKQSSW
jgi:hypothetical protein